MRSVIFRLPVNPIGITCRDEQRVGMGKPLKVSNLVLSWLLSAVRLTMYCIFGKTVKRYR